MKSVLAASYCRLAALKLGERAKNQDGHLWRQLILEGHSKAVEQSISVYHSQALAVLTLLKHYMLKTFLFTLSF